MMKKRKKETLKWITLDVRLSCWGGDRVAVQRKRQADEWIDGLFSPPDLYLHKAAQC